MGGDHLTPKQRSLVDIAKRLAKTLEDAQKLRLLIRYYDEIWEDYFGRNNEEGSTTFSDWRYGYDSVLSEGCDLSPHGTESVPATDMSVGMDGDNN